MTNYLPNSQPALTKRLPTMYDLPSEDPEEPGLPDEFHDFQPELLRKTCRPSNYPIEQLFIASDLNIYYDLNHTNWYKRPDWFVVLGVSRFREDGDGLRLSYVIWDELVSPLIVVELLSAGTEDEDLGLKEAAIDKPPPKWEVYERILRIPYYIVFDRIYSQLRVFRLVGNRYREQALINGSRFWIPELELSIGLWEGFYEGHYRMWLRWYDADGELILNPEEERELALEIAEEERVAKESALSQAEQERLAKESALSQAEQERLAKESAFSQAEQERLARELEQQRADRMAARLRAMGLDPDEL
ncbi:MAG: Uma2 family endonuclease [Richelia sp. CSU_2_1]|nr:Uma2 family endonuclease [Richelia sp. CSU_2_1]